METKLIELCRINKEFATPHYYKANGKRISKERYDTLQALSQQTNCLVVGSFKNNYYHYSTVRVPNNI